MLWTNLMRRIYDGAESWLVEVIESDKIQAHAMRWLILETTSAHTRTVKNLMTLCLQ